MLTSSHAYTISIACSGKTTLMFQFAFNLACQDREVWLLCVKEKLDRTPPLMAMSLDVNHVAFNNIKLK